MTILARWVHRGMEQGPKFWYLLGGVVVVVVLDHDARQRPGAGAVVGRQGVERAERGARRPARRSRSPTPIRAARSPASPGSRRPPNTSSPPRATSRPTARPPARSSRRRWSSSSKVDKEAPKDSPEALAAAFGVARTLEARNELPEAIEAVQGRRLRLARHRRGQAGQALAERLRDPEVVAFYKELYTYKAPAASLPPGLSGLPADHPRLNGPAIAAPALMGPSGSDLLKDLTARPSPAPARGPGPLDIAPPRPTPSPSPVAEARDPGREGRDPGQGRRTSQGPVRPGDRKPKS